MLLARILSVAITCSLAASCAMTLPLRGQTTTGDETFTGKATGYADGGGTLELTSSKGRNCSGNFVYVTHRNGEGTFTCTNGQSGDFRFVSTGVRGTGTGSIGGKSFTFTFG